MSILISLNEDDKKHIEEVSRSRYLRYGSKIGSVGGCFNKIMHSERGMGNIGEKVVSNASGAVWNNELWDGLSLEEIDERQKNEHDIGEICEVRFTNYCPAHLIVRPRFIANRKDRYFDEYKMRCPFILVTTMQSVKASLVSEENDFLIIGWILGGDAFGYKDNIKSNGDGSCWVPQNELIPLNNIDELKMLTDIGMDDWLDVLRIANKKRGESSLSVSAWDVLRKNKLQSDRQIEMWKFGNMSQGSLFS